MMHRIYLFIFIFLIANNIAAQNEKVWADSLMACIPIDQTNQNSIIPLYGEKLLKIYTKEDEPCNKIKVHLFLSDHYRQIGSYQIAIRHAFLANKDFKESKCKSESLEPNIYLKYASIYAEISDANKVLYYANKGINCSNMDSHSEELMRFYVLKGSFTNNPNEELKLYTVALNLAIEKQNKKLEEIALISIGTFYAIHENFALAEKNLKNGLFLAHQRNANSTLSALYNNLAGIGLSNQKTELYIDSAVYFAEKSKNLNDLQTALQNKAYFLQNRNKFKEGYEVLWQSIAVKDSLFNRDKVKSFADMEQKYESEIKNIEIAFLQRESEIAKLKASRSLGINFGLAGALIGLIFVSFAFYTQNKKKQKLNIELQKEKSKSDNLLLNILPEEIAEELKTSGKSEAKLYNQVSVLFTDFVNFTGHSEQMSPTQLVQEIHQNFTAFDAIMEKHGIEKIKTIGDAYLAVCGLPHENSNHAQKIILAALDIIHLMNTNNSKFQIRIGIHSGPVVAGIVGVKKYAYDIWGDTVNTASRMEANSESGKINISGDTYNLIKGQFNCTYRGKINAKNKGEIDMYFVNSSL